MVPTIDIECKEFPFGTLSSDVAKWLVDYFVNGYPDYKVESIQVCPEGIARVSFRRESRSAKESL